MYPLVEAYLAGSQSRIDFCRAHELTISTLSYWVTHYRKAQAAAERSVASGESTGFVPLSLADAPSAAVALELHLPSGAILRFYRYPDPAYLTHLLSLQRC